VRQDPVFNTAVQMATCAKQTYDLAIFGDEDVGWLLT